MTLYAPINSFVENLRKLFKNRVKDGRKAYLGDGTGRCEVPDRLGYYYYRFELGGSPSIARSGNASFPVYEGSEVYIAIGYNDEPEIVGAVYQRLDQSGVDTRTFNQMHQQSKWVYLWQITIGQTIATATSTTNSLLVSVKKHLTYFNNTFSYFETGEEADKFDFTPYPTAADEHRYALVWRDAYGNVGEITASTAQSLFMPLDIGDVNEATAQRPPDGVPYKAFVLANNGNTLRQSITEIDLRQFLNVPQTWGFPNPVAYRERIHPDRQVLFAGSQVVTGSLEVLGSLIGISGSGGSGSGGMTDFDITADAGSAITVTDGDTVNVTGEEGINTETSGFDVIVRGRKYTLSPASNPTTGDDDTQGYVTFSLWINETSNRLFYCVDASTGAAVWRELIAASPLTGQTLQGIVINGATINIISDPNSDFALAFGGDGHASNANYVGIGTFTNVPRIYTDGGTNTNLEIMPEGTGLIVSGATVVSDTDNTDDLGTAAVKWRNMLAFLATLEERSTPSTPATGDAAAYAKASGNGGALFSIDDAGTELQLSPQIAIILDSQASGSNAGATTTTTWVTRPIQTEVDPYALVTLSSNKFTPVAGVYDVLVFATAIANSAAVTLAVHRLFNVTGTAEIGKSPPVRLVADTGSTASFETKLTANGSDEFRVDTYVTSGRATNGLGQPVSTGSNEVFTIIVLRKIG